MRESEIIKRFGDVWKVLSEIETQRRKNAIQINKVTIVQNALLKAFILYPPIKYIIQYLVRREEKLQRKLIGEAMVRQWKENEEREAEQEKTKIQPEKKKECEKKSKESKQHTNTK